MRFADGETTASYAYNVNGLRIEKIVDGQRTNHVWDGSQQIVADIIDSEYYEAQCYIRGTSLAATYRYQNAEKSGYTYYVQNAHGDVVNLTDAEGAVTKTYRYDAFGVELSPVTGDVNVFRYCGEYFDTETGTVYLRARYYQASIGRFTQRDTVAGKLGDPLSLNLYTYCHNNPIFYFDPSGHKAGKSTDGFGGNGWHGYHEYDDKFEELKHVLSVGKEVTIRCIKSDVDEAAVNQKKNIPIYKSIYSKFVNSPKSYDKSIGGAFGMSFDFGTSLTFDKNGDMSLLWSYSTGFSTDFVGVSYSSTTTTINGNSIDDFMGKSWVDGGALSIPAFGPLSAGFTTDRLESFDGKIVGKSKGNTIGVSCGLFGPLELHHKTSSTNNTDMLTSDMVQFNLFEYYEYVMDEAIRWSNS